MHHINIVHICCKVQIQKCVQQNTDKGIVQYSIG
jgi:hypothetical protein